MDEEAFLRWSDKLTDLRRKRQIYIDQQLREKADSFGPDAFYEAAKGSIENIMDAWFGFEQQSWKDFPPSDAALAAEAAAKEMDSTVDFEIDAIERDKNSITERVTWDPAAVAMAVPPFEAFTEEIRKRYQLKTRSLAGGVKKRNEAPLTPSNTGFTGHSSRSSSVGLFVMFLVGLLFGGAPSIYFMDIAKKSESGFQDERAKMIAEQRALEDGMTVLHDNFSQLAQGKASSIPQLEKEIGQVKASIVEQRQRAESEYQRERERALKKVPAGDKQDKALADAEEKRNERLAQLRSREEAALEPLIKQRDILKDLLK